MLEEAVESVDRLTASEHEEERGCDANRDRRHGDDTFAETRLFHANPPSLLEGCLHDLSVGRDAWGVSNPG